MLAAVDATVLILSDRLLLTDSLVLLPPLKDVDCWPLVTMLSLFTVLMDVDSDLLILVLMDSSVLRLILSASDAESLALVLLYWLALSALA